ncbi:MAG: YdeI/OmpD-associated family protein [Bacteroidota bacterium]
MANRTSTDFETYYPASKEEWRNWLTENHIEKDSIWVVMVKKSANQATITWSDAVDEALCFGWIDSTKRKLDEQRSIQYFTKRKPKSTWSKINKQKVEALLEQGLMTEAGLKCVEIAKQNGSWTILDSVENLEIPSDLESALATQENAMEFFLGLSKSVRKMMLHWVQAAKRPETREHRIKEIVDNTSKKQKPKQF